MNYVYYAKMAGATQNINEFIDLIRNKANQSCIVDDEVHYNDYAEVVVCVIGTGVESLIHFMYNTTSPSLAQETERLQLTVDMFSNSVGNMTQEHITISNGKQLEYEVANFNVVNLDEEFEAEHDKADCELYPSGSLARLNWYNAKHGTSHELKNVVFGEIWTDTLFPPGGIDKYGLILSNKQMREINNRNMGLAPEYTE